MLQLCGEFRAATSPCGTIRTLRLRPHPIRLGSRTKFPRASREEHESEGDGAVREAGTADRHASLETPQPQKRRAAFARRRPPGEVIGGEPVETIAKRHSVHRRAS